MRNNNANFARDKQPTYSSERQAICSSEVGRNKWPQKIKETKNNAQ